MRKVLTMLLQTKNYKQFRLSSSISFDDYKLANRCLPGDKVDWVEGRCKLVERATHRFLPGVLEVNSKYVFGHSTRGNKLFLFHPHDRKYPPFRVGANSRNLTTNQLGLVEFMDWEEYESMPRGTMIRVLGPCGDFTAERLALTYQYSSPKLAKELFDVDDCEKGLRIHLEGFTFNIDPDGCLDIDDVLTLKQISDTKWQFVISISDVACHIKEGSEGDKHAYLLGQTLYQDGEAVVPMLPPALSEMAFSLRPQEEHMGISLFCTWDTQTKTVEIHGFHETVFTNNQSYTYETIYKADEFPLSILRDICSSLHGSPTDDSHEWIADCMVLYNKEVAKRLVGNNAGLLRTHKPADSTKLKEFLAIHPDLGILAYESAKYEPSGPGLLHAGLGSVPYCHASSPIRRYADLVNQRALKALLSKQPCGPVSTDLASHLNQIQKRMKAYERSLFFLEQIAKQPTGYVEGFVVSSTDEKTKVYVPSWKLSIRVDPGMYTVGQAIQLQYYADLQKPYWDQRMVFRVTSEATEDAKLSESNE